jgi:hypothetical protein
MQRFYQEKLEKIYSSCTSILAPDIWNHVVNLCAVDSDPYKINPTVHYLQLSWKNLPLALEHNRKTSSNEPEPREEYVFV